MELPLEPPKIPVCKHYGDVVRFNRLDSGPQRCIGLFKAWANLMRPDETDVFRMYLQDIWPEPDFGSICSGTDIPALVCRDFWNWALPHFNVGGKFSHRFSCEIDPKKRGFIHAVHKDCQALFGDVVDLSEKQAWCFLEGKAKEVPEVKSMAAGFPCQDISPLNPHSRSDTNRNCVANGTLRTGSVFGGIVGYLKKRRAPLQVCLMENVASLAHQPKGGGPSNLDVVGSMLSELGLHLHVWQLSPRLFGVPQSRSRVWMTVFSRTALQKAEMSKDCVTDTLNELMSTLTGWPENTIESYLVRPRTDCSQCFQLWLSELPGLWVKAWFVAVW